MLKKVEVDRKPVMTTDASSNEYDALSKCLIVNREVVTYHTIARSFNLHINQAKSLLYDFYRQNRDTLTASFVISGHSSRGIEVRLSKDETRLEEDAKDFDKINGIHVYSLCQKDLQVSNVDIAVEESKHPTQYDKVDDIFTRGMIKGLDLVAGEIVLPPAERKSTASSTISTPNQSPTKRKLKSAGLSSGYVSRKAQKSEPSKENRASTRPKTDLLSNYTSRKGENSKQRTTEQRSATEPVSSGYQYRSRKLEKKAPKERVIVSNDGQEGLEENDNEIPKQEERSSSTKNTQKNVSDLNNLFNDEFSDESDHQEEAPEPIMVGTKAGDAADDNEEQSSAVTGSHDAKSKPAPTTASKKELPKDPNQKQLDMDTLRASKLTSPSSETKPAQENEPKESKVDESGYITSYRKNNTSGNTKGDKKKAQASLMNFFKPK